MDAKTARETVIRPKLAELFGNTMASALTTQATLAGMQGTTEQDKLRRMVEAICSSPKVVGMLGAAQMERQKREWLRLV